MLNLTDITDILNLLKQKSENGCLNINGKHLTTSQANEILINFIENIIIIISKNPTNMEIEKTIHLKSIKSPEEVNAMRWFNEAKSFPNWYTRAKLPQTDIFDNHTKLVAKQTILLMKFLEDARNKFNL